jgi:O-antigen ligase
LPVLRNQLTHIPQSWLRPVMIAGILLAVAVLAFTLAPYYVGLLLMLLWGLAGVLLFLYCPQWGLLALIAACLIVPFEMGTGTGTSLHAGILVLALLLGLWVVDMLILGRRRWLASSRPVLPLLLLVITTVLAFLSGQLPWFPTPSAPLAAQIGGLSIFVLCAGAFLLAAYQIQDLRWLEWLTWLFLALGTPYIATRLIPGLGGVLGPILQNGVFNQGLFWTWFVAMAFSQAVLNRHLRPIWRIVLFGLVLMAFYVSMLQLPGWTSGWLPGLIAVVVMLAAAAPELGTLVALGFGVVVALGASKVMDLLMIGDNTEFTLTSRLEAYRIVLDIIQTNPILGLGPANYYWYTHLYLIKGYRLPFNSHSQYIDLVAQTGLLGLAFFIWFAWEVGRLAWRLRTRVPAGFAQAYVYGVLGGLVGTLVAGILGDWFLPFVYNVGMAGLRSSIIGWFFLGGLVLVANEVLPSGARPDRECRS